MTLTHCFDAVKPPAAPPAGFQAAAIYVGGSQAERVWTHEDCLTVAHLAQFPFYVPDMVTDPTAQAADACRIAKSMGWSDYGGPMRRVIVYDLETARDEEWWAVVQSITYRHGYLAVAYGSTGYVTENKADYYWGAHYGVPPVLPEGSEWWALQYEADFKLPDGTLIDLSVCSAEIMHHAGHGARKSPHAT